MTVKLLHDTVVRFPAGSVLEVSDEEGKRLMSFGNAKEEKAEVKAEKPEKKPAKKKA